MVLGHAFFRAAEVSVMKVRLPRLCLSVCGYLLQDERG
jgi:hypothetical protein